MNKIIKSSVFVGDRSANLIARHVICRRPEGLAPAPSTSKLWLLAGREDSEETSTSKLWLLAGREYSEETSTSKLCPG